ncbi:MAG: serine hydrolase domain-containing protein [Acetobacteraceae bacterium]|nr:serine hydrolase domain-containing protein [Acetobacteraceae bacterium]
MDKAVCERVGLSADRLGRIDGWMQRWVDSGRLAGMSVLVSRRGQIAYESCYGQSDRERGTAMSPETIVRIYSMTKPLTSVALMMLYEEGRFQLDDPIHAVLPAFRQTRVWDGEGRDPVPLARPISYRDLLTHTSGLTYGFMNATPVDAMYRSGGVDFQTADATLGEVVDKAAAMPLLAQPGAAWNYSIATDVIGHLVAEISGMSFATFLHDRVIAPLGMSDTAFTVAPGKVSRFAANYSRGEDGRAALLDDPVTSRFVTRDTKAGAIASGGGGLTGTARDYLRFCQMMLAKGTTADGERLLGRKTVELMTSNHLGGDMAAMGMPRFSESKYDGVGFGLGFSIMLDPAKAEILGTPGEFAWGGAASTAFWVDPVEDMAVVLLTQLTPSSTYPIRRELRVLTYASVVD